MSGKVFITLGLLTITIWYRWSYNMFFSQIWNLFRTDLLYGWKNFIFMLFLSLALFLFLFHQHFKSVKFYFWLLPIFVFKNFHRVRCRLYHQQIRKVLVSSHPIIERKRISGMHLSGFEKFTWHGWDSPSPTVTISNRYT